MMAITYSHGVSRNSFINNAKGNDLPPITFPLSVTLSLYPQSLLKIIKERNGYRLQTKSEKPKN